MTEVDRAIGPELAAPRLDQPGLGELDLAPADVQIALVTSAASLAVLVYGMNAGASAPIFIVLHLAVLIIPAVFLRMRVRGNGELTVPVLLLVATFAAGPGTSATVALLASGVLFRVPVIDAVPAVVGEVSVAVYVPSPLSVTADRAPALAASPTVPPLAVPLPNCNPQSPRLTSGSPAESLSVPW